MEKGIGRCRTKQGDKKLSHGPDTARFTRFEIKALESDREFIRALKPQPSDSLLEWLAAQRNGDLFIAAAASARECVVVTDNEKDFTGFQIVNPMRGTA